MKRAIIISSLLLLFFSQVGYQFIYIIQQHKAKEDAEKQLLSTLPESSLEVIDLSADKNDIQWEEEGKEFYLRGQLYDVAKTKNVNGRTLLYCLNDKKEKQVLQDLSKAVGTGNDQSTDSKGGKHTIKFQLTDLFAFSESAISIQEFIPQKHINFNVPIISSIKKIITPPPKLKSNV